MLAWVRSNFAAALTSSGFEMHRKIPFIFPADGREVFVFDLSACSLAIAFAAGRDHVVPSLPMRCEAQAIFPFPPAGHYCTTFWCGGRVLLYPLQSHGRRHGVSCQRGARHKQCDPRVRSGQNAERTRCYSVGIPFRKLRFSSCGALWPHRAKNIRENIFFSSLALSKRGEYAKLQHWRSPNVGKTTLAV